MADCKAAMDFGMSGISVLDSKASLGKGREFLWWRLLKEDR